MRTDTFVLDASTFGAALFNEADTPSARRFLTGGIQLIAPDLLFAEIASLTAKKVWRREISPEAGPRALSALRDFVGEFVASEVLAAPAFELAASHRFSAYDGIYLALAEMRQVRVVTLDQKLIDRAENSGMGRLVIRPDQTA